MIKITKKEVEIIKKIGVAIEPEVTTLYSACAFNKKVEKIKDVVFEEVVTKTNGIYLKFKTDYDNYRVYINPETLEVTEDNDAFLDYEMAVKIHKEKRVKYLKSSIASFKKNIECSTKYLEENEKLLEELKKEKENETN